MLSVNTNPSALLAVRNVVNTRALMGQVQTRLATGLEVATAEDDSAKFQIAQNMRGDLGGYRASLQSLDRAISSVSVALAAAETISDTLLLMKEKIVAAVDAGLDQASRDALGRDFFTLADQIATAYSNAEFNGTNMIAAGGDSVSAIVSPDGTRSIVVAAEDLSHGGPILNLIIGAPPFGSATFAPGQPTAGNVTAMEQSLDRVNQAVTRLASGLATLERQRTFNTKAMDALETGIGNLVDADMARETARLQALQAREQIGLETLAIANRIPQAILSLF